MRSAINMGARSCRIAALSISAAFLFILAAERQCEAMTQIDVNEADCTIQLHVKKEFYQPRLATEDAWINEAQNAIDYYNAFIGPLSVEQQGQLQFYTGRLANLRNARDNYTVNTKAVLEAKVQDWKRQVEAKWNAEPYIYHCCRVTVLFDGRVRPTDWWGTPEQGTAGYDQIAIIVPGPHNTFRSSVSGVGSFDANGFSNDPYNHDLTGQWTFNPTQDYTIPHEVGHELGLRDRYHLDPATGRLVPDEGYGSSLLGITGPTRATGRVIVRLRIMGVNTVIIDHIGEILRGTNTQCPPKCCPDYVPPSRGRRVRDTAGPLRGEPRIAQPLYEASRDYHRTTETPPDTTHVPKGESAKPVPVDAVRPTDSGHGTDTIPAPTGTDVTQGPPTGTDITPGPPTPTPTGIDVSQGPPATSHPTDAASGGGNMPLTEPQPLTDTSGFDKVPPTDLSSYETGVMKPGTEEIQYKQLQGDRLTCDTAVSYKQTPEGMDVTTASVATGKGADFRKWKVDGVRMDIDGEVIKPDKEEDFYVEKESYYREAAAATFAVIGSQYRRYSGEAQSGEVCPVTGQKKEASERKDTMADGIDRAGMAAGLGLLASQAKGEIHGKKAVFNLDKEQAKKVLDKKGRLKVTAKNESAHEQQTVKMPLH